MAEELYHCTPTKTDQLAAWLLEQGKSMTAREVYDAGFRYRFGAETTIQTISSLLNKLHENNRYSVDRHYIEGKGARVTSVHVKGIIKKRTVERGMGATEMRLWWQLITKPSGTAVQVAA
ncbi:hypothetical protein [Aeromonas hydrophila]|uniref:hypothetical protein n=1 Tax=Aeromonas hydrophila TaxID=644 RepID=UPI00080A9A59|nr:hypothetical protein [Aeromonas hydrophila]ANT70197.1 hypothetical protein TK34_22230 [Aeromonas hydrophila]